MPQLSFQFFSSPVPDNAYFCLQFVSASQPLNALAYIFDGLHYGVSDFPFAACSMVSGP